MESGSQILGICALPPGAQELETHRRLQRRLEQREKFNNLTVQELAQQIEQRHRQQAVSATWINDDVGAMDFSREANLPTVTDPKLYCVKCKPGEERNLMLRLMNKQANTTPSTLHPPLKKHSVHTRVPRSQHGAGSFL